MKGTGGDKNQTTSGKLGKIFFEDIVITAAVVVGILGGAVMSLFLQAEPIIVGIFFGMGISSLVYRFLGGIGQDNSFAVKGIKLTGTAAVWIACALIVSSNLGSKFDIETTKLVLTVTKDMRLAQNVEVRAGEEEEIIPPFKREDGTEVKGKFGIPLKLLLGDGYIFIKRKSDTRRTEESLTLKYDASRPKITVVLDRY